MKKYDKGIQDAEKTYNEVNTRMTAKQADNKKLEEPPRESYSLDLTVEEYVAVKKFMEIRRKLSELDGGAILFTAKALIACERIANEIMED